MPDAVAASIPKFATVRDVFPGGPLFRFLRYDVRLEPIGSNSISTSS